MRRTGGFTLIEQAHCSCDYRDSGSDCGPNFLNAQVRAKIARSYADMRNTGTAIEMLRADKGVLLIDLWDDDYEWGTERIMKVFNGAGYQSNQLQRTTLDVLAPLTTPVSYLSSIPLDPFIEKQGVERHGEQCRLPLVYLRGSGGSGCRYRWVYVDIYNPKRTHPICMG